MHDNKYNRLKLRLSRTKFRSQQLKGSLSNKCLGTMLYMQIWRKKKIIKKKLELGKLLLIILFLGQI